MTSGVPPIARVRLARSLPRLLAVPVALMAVGTAVIGLALLAGGSSPILTLVMGGLLVLVGLMRGVMLLSVRLDIEESAVRVRAIGTDRSFALVPGPVTRVTLRGEHASRMRSGTRLLGYDLGRARLRDEEQIEVVRLAPTSSVILIPTDLGRLAVAPADESALLDALSRAARARQRLDTIAAPPPRDTDASDAAELALPPPMTGIERAIHERRTAEERAAAEADQQRLVAAQQAEADAAAAAISAPPEPDAARAERSDRGAKVGSRGRLRVPRPRWIRRPEPSIALIVLPMLGAAAAWGVGVTRDSLPATDSDVGRLVMMALLLAGPGTTIGAIAARVWWPRLVAVVVAGGLVSAAFVGRALLG
ncbi:MAG: hypothetical protein ABIW50_02145 [Candidatus Limnocylindria bacterium]